MGKNLDMVITFKGKDYFGRTVHFHNKEMDCDEELVMFESALGDEIEPYVLGNKEDENYEDAMHIFDNVFYFVPKEILKQSDKAVIDWGWKNNMDL